MKNKLSNTIFTVCCLLSVSAALAVEPISPIQLVKNIRGCPR